jgi:hypothetical protein
MVPSPHGRLMLTVLGIAEFERDLLILQGTNEGRVGAMAEGIRFGRRPKLTKHRAREALKRVAAGETLREIALSLQRRSLDDLPAQGGARRGGLIGPGVQILGVRSSAPRPGGTRPQRMDTSSRLPDLLVRYHAFSFTGGPK